MPRAFALALFAVISLLVACASPTREGFQLDPVVPATADQLGVARDQLQGRGRVDLVRPGTRVTAVDGGLFVEMPLNEATPQFVERLTARGEVAIVAVPADAETPIAGQRLDLPPLIRQAGLTAVRLSEVDGRPVLDLGLDPPSTRLLAGHTTGHVGEALAIVVDGLVVSAPIIMQPILDGRLQIAGGSADPDHALAWIAGALRHGALEIELTGGPYGPD